MKYDYLDFTIDDGYGNDIECNIISMLKMNDNEILVLFIDDERDEKDNVVLKYGKLLKNDDDYELISGVSEDELDSLKKEFEKDLLEIPNLVFQNN